MAGIHALHGIAAIFLWKRVVPMVWIADDLRFATRLSNVYEHAIRAKLANAQTSARWRIRSQVSLRKTCKASAYPYHRHPRFFHKSSVCDSVSNAWFPAIYATPNAKRCFCFRRLWHTAEKKPGFHSKRPTFGVKYKHATSYKFTKELYTIWI